MTAPTTDIEGVVSVVAGRPRYHVEDCRHILDKETQELTLSEAKAAGFTGCGVCKPDDVVAQMPVVPRSAVAPGLIPTQAGPPQPEWGGVVAAPKQPKQPKQKGTGLAITALVLAIFALLLCWVPIVNNLAAVIAVVGLIFGIPALVSARRGKRAGQGMAWASVVISLLAFVGVLATQALYVKAIDDVAASIDEATTTSSSDDSGSPAATTGDDSTPAAPAVLKVGQSAVVGDYRVTVTKVVANANAIIARTNEFNDKPKHRFTLVNATITYVGSEQGTPWLDLDASILGSDGRQYDDGATSVVTPLSDQDQVKLSKGGTSQIDFAMDLSVAALTGSQIAVEPSFSLSDEKVLWAVG